MKEDFGALQYVRDMCQDLGISFSIHFNSFDCTWFGELISPEITECFTTVDSGTINMVVDQMLGFLRSLDCCPDKCEVCGCKGE